MYRVIGSKIQRIQDTFYLPMNLTVLSDPSPDYVLADMEKGLGHFSLSLSSQAKKYLCIFSHPKIASDCHPGVIPGPCYLPVVSSVTGERT